MRLVFEVTFIAFWSRSATQYSLEHHDSDREPLQILDTVQLHAGVVLVECASSSSTAEYKVTLPLCPTSEMITEIRKQSRSRRARCVSLGPLVQEQDSGFRQSRKAAHCGDGDGAGIRFAS